MDNQKTDLRVIRTKKAIRDTFCEMITEMDYHAITVKELTERAMINRNTFYLHYTSIDALLEELQNEIADTFISMYIPYGSIDDTKKMIRNYFEYATSQSDLQARIFCSGSYRFVAEKINKRIVAHQREAQRGVLGISEAAEDIVLAYCGSVSAILFRQWIADGKKMPVEELIDLAIKLICHGMDSVLNK